MIKKKKPIMPDPHRGTGRTKRMVMDLPEDGCMVVAHNQDGLTYIRNMIGDLRGGSFLKSVRLSTLAYVENLRGLDLPIFVDHFVLEYAFDRHLHREYEILLQLQQHAIFRRASK
jgi:hypothetical protein